MREVISCRPQIRPAGRQVNSPVLHLSLSLILFYHTRHFSPFLQSFQPASTHYFTTFPHSPLLWTVDPKYLLSSTFFIPAPCSLTVTLGFLSLTHMYSSRLSMANLHFSPFQVIPPPLWFFLQLLPALTTDHNVTGKHHSP